MRLSFDTSLAKGYLSGSQRARRMSEGWFQREMFCAACGANAIKPHANNARGNDFFCADCGAHFELKSGKGGIGSIVPDGAFEAMMERISRPGGGPHLALLRYCATGWMVRDLFVVPAPFLTPDVIVRRKPLAATARRAGWVGCNIRIDGLPQAGRVAVVRDGVALARADVLRGVRLALALPSGLVARTWFVDVLRCVERLGAEFTLEQVYAFEAELAARHPANQNIRAKLRQQLQRLRNDGFLLFLGKGRYRRATPP
jgi:type II restriction enzyme